MDMIEKLSEIIRRKNEGEISSEEAENMKYDLVKGIGGDKEVEFDNSCST